MARTSLLTAILVLAAVPAWAQDPGPGLLEFPIDARPGVRVTAASAAVFPDGGFVVAWTSFNETVGVEALARRYDAAGRPREDAFHLVLPDGEARDGISVAVGADGGFVAVWSERRPVAVFARRYDAAAAPLEEPFELSADGASASDPAVVTDDDGGWTVLWEERPPGGLSHVAGRRFDPAAGAWDPPFELDGDGGTPRLATVPTGGLLAVWLGRDEASGERAYLGRRITPSGEALGETFLVNETTLRLFGYEVVDVACDGSGRCLVAWFNRVGDNDRLWVRFFAADGSPASDELRLASRGRLEVPNVAAAARPSGDVTVAWNFEGELFGRLADPPSAALTSEDFRLTLHRVEGSPPGFDLAAGPAGLVAVYAGAGSGLWGRLLPDAARGGVLRLADDPARPFSTVGEGAGDVRIRVLRLGDVRGDAEVELLAEDLEAKAGEDYVPLAREVRFADGEAERRVPLTVLDDARVEGTERFQVRLENPTAGVPVGPPTPVTVSLVDDDFTADPGSPPLGEPFTVATGNGGERFPRVAASEDGAFMVVWQRRLRDERSQGVYGRLYDAQGRPRGDEIELSGAPPGSQWMPNVTAVPGGDFFVTWNERSTFPDFVRGRRVAAAGSGAPRLLGVSNLGSCRTTCESEAIARGDGTVVAWYDFRGSAADPYALVLRRFDAAGRPLGQASEVSIGARSFGLAPAPDGGFAIAWNQSLSPVDTRFSLQRFDHQGVPTEGFAVVPEAPGRVELHPGVVHQGRDLLVVWQDLDGAPDPVPGDGLLPVPGSDVLVRRFGGDGTPTGAVGVLDPYLPDVQLEPRVAATPGGDAAAVWTAEGSNDGTPRVFLQRFDPDGGRRGGRLRVDPSANAQRRPAVAVDSRGTAVVVWEETNAEGDVGIASRRFAGPSGTPPCVATTTRLCLGNRFALDVDWRAPDGRTGLGRAVPLTPDTGAFWFFNNENLELVVKVLDGRSFNNHFWVFYGSLSNVAFNLAVTDTATGATKRYRNAQGNFASVGDTMALPGTPGDALLFSQKKGFTLKDTQVVPDGSEIMVAGGGAVHAPRVAMTAAGDFLVAWVEDDPEGNELFARTFGKGGTPRGDAFEVTSVVPNYVIHPAVTALPDGRFLVTWATRGPFDVGSDSTLSARWVTPMGAGAPEVSPEVVLDVEREFDSLDVAADSAGRFVVSWGASIYRAPDRIGTQRFDAGGSTLGPVSEVATARSTSHAVSSGPGGDFLLIWNQGSRLGARRHDDLGVPVLGGDQVLDDGTLRSDDAPRPSTARQADGGGVVVWQGRGTATTTGGGFYDVYAHWFGPDGTPRGETVSLDVDPGEHTAPRVATSGRGESVVVWEKGGDLGARRYGVDGRFPGEPFVVNPAAWPQVAPDVASSADGDFVVVWEAETQPGDFGVFAQRFDALASVTCSRDRVLCLGGERFELEVTWRDQNGKTGRGRAVPLTDDTGAFWFFNEENVELVVKVLDGREITGHYWVFYASLSNVEFELSVRDIVTGATKSYLNRQGSFASVGDVMALPGKNP